MAEHEREAIVRLLEHVLDEAKAGRVSKLVAGWITDQSDIRTVTSDMFYVEALGMLEIIKANAIAAKEGRDVNGT